MIETKIETKEFTLAEVLGVASGYLLEDGGFSRLHELMEWVAGGGVLTHQISAMAHIFRAALIKQFPQFSLENHVLLKRRIENLVKAIGSGDKEVEATIMNALVAEYGARFQVKEGVR
jgi:hypothetical protein